MQTIQSIHKLVSNIKYLNWDIMIRQYAESDRPYIQIQFDAPCSVTGVVERQFCRKWSLSRHMTDSEVVDTVYKAIKGAVLHELDENFKYKGERIKNPHFDVDSLVDFCRTTPSSKRGDDNKVTASDLVMTGTDLELLAAEMGYLE